MESPHLPPADDGSKERSKPLPQVDGSWARAIRLRLATELQEVGHAEAKHVEALVAHLIAVFTAVLQKSSRKSWLHLMEALRLLAPFRKLLSGRAELVPYLEGLYYQYLSSQALVSDLDVLGAIGQAFPDDWSVLGPALRATACQREPAPPARQLPANQEPVFAGLPYPFVTDWVMKEASGLLQPRPVSLQELQRCVGAIGSKVAQEESTWRNSLGLMALTLATDVPAEFPCAEAKDMTEPHLEPDSEATAEAAPDPTPKKTETGGEQPMTGLQAAEAFVRSRHMGKINFLYLNIAHSRHFRPYDLVAVPKHLVNAQHYVFSPFGVLHVHPEEGSEAMSLGDWHRDAVVWQLMQYIPFFRLFLVRKAFVRWCCNVKHLQHLKRREMLSSELLLAVPHFGTALLHISRLLQELRCVHWVPQYSVKCYSFPELKRVLAQENHNARDLLSRFLTLCSSILELVRDDTYTMVNGLQTQMQNYKLNITQVSLYHQRMQSETLQRHLREAESWLKRLGFLALLVNFLICQNLVSIVQQEVTAFVSNTMKADGTQRKAVIQAQLVFSAENQLMLFPSPRELEECLLGALETVVDSVLQVTQNQGDRPGTLEAQAEPGVPQKEGPGTQAVEGFCRATEQLQRLPTEVLCGEEPQLVHRLDLKAIGGLEVVGHRLRGQYPLLSREQLEKDLRSDSIIQNALAKQQALLKAALSETQQLCHEYAWLSEIYRFVHSWGTSMLEAMKGWPPEEYVNRTFKLRTWAARVQKVPQTVVTRNFLLFVDCSGIHQNILPLLASINEDILALLLSETSQRSDVLIAELSSVLQLYLNVSSDIFTIAKCSQKLEQYQAQMATLQEDVEYVRGLNEAIQHCFRPLSATEESLENVLLDTWDAFVYQQREVSDFIVTRRLSIIAELSSSLQKATWELQEMLATVTMGRFRDPAQNPRAMEEELHQLLHCFQATVVRVNELCRSQRILTGECTDVSFITGSQGVIEIHARVWQLFRIITEQITEWKCLAFTKFSTALAVEKTEQWQREAINIQRTLPSNHPMLQACFHTIANFQMYLPLLLKLSSPFLKLSCWKEIFAVMAVKCPLNMQFTLGQLLSYPLLEYSDTIFRIYACEKSRHRSRDTLHRLQRAWTEKQFRLVNFILNVPYQEPHPDRYRRPASGRQRTPKIEYIAKDSGTYVLSDIAELKAAVEQSLLTLQNMILSPYCSDIQEEAESWASLLRAFESLLAVWVSFQQKWVFLNIVLYEMDISLPSAELDLRFQRVDAHFREFMQVTCSDPLVLSSVRTPLGSSRESRFVGGPLQATFTEGSGDLQIIIRALDYVLEATRMGFPRLFFLSNEELVAMLATAAETADASAWAQRCFPGVRQLQVQVPSSIQSRGTFSAELPTVQVTGLVGDHGEKLKLCSMVPLSHKATQWLCTLEHRMKESLFSQLQSCMVQRLTFRPQLDKAFEHSPGPTELPLHLVAERWATLGVTFPSQCVLVAEEALWRADMEEALSNQQRQETLKLKLALKLDALAHYIRNYRILHTFQPNSDHLGILLGALLVITIQQRDTLAQLLDQQVCSPQDFVWAQRLKYRVALKPEKARALGMRLDKWVDNPPGCWAEVFDSRLPYDYEYLGPCVHLLGSPSLDKTFLGLLLALEEFRCGGLLGHPGVGKSHTVQGLAQALGRQLVTLHCSVQMSIGCLSRHLCGAVHAGALLLLESAELLETAVLSAFSQRLVDLQRVCMSLRESRGPTAGQTSAGPSPVSPDSESSESSESEGKPTVPLPELGLDEAAPFHPRVLGNILFGGRLLRVRETYGCMATLQHYPEPLRLPLRPLAILPPDLPKLAEALLLAAGFREASRLASKLSTFLRLEGELHSGRPPNRAGLLREVIRMTLSILFSPSPEKGYVPMKAKLSARAAFFLGLEEEPAIIKALCLSPLLSGPECARLGNVRDLLRCIFPAAALQLPEAEAPHRVQAALLAQLREDKLYHDAELLSIAGQLSQALQGAPGILLLGPSGSGKTTIWRLLAKALSRLAASDAVPGAAHHPVKRQETDIRPVSTVCLWPNGLSVAEFLGNLEGGIWQDGVLSRLLGRAAASTLAGTSGVMSNQQWLVLDGAACVEWLEPISSLFSIRPSLSLPSGQRLLPSKTIKFLFEMLDASGMPPSACTHCALVHCAGSGLWQVLLTSALAPVYRTYSLTQETLAMLRDLAEDLFPPTLAFLQQHCCSVLLAHSGPRNPMAQGVQEITAFTRILHALLEQHLRRDKTKFLPAHETTANVGSLGSSSVPTAHSLDDGVSPHNHLLAQSIFVFAYIWGFGGHLHSRHWVLFNHFARRALYNSRFAIDLPGAPSVFDLCPVPDGSLEPFDGRYIFSRVKSIPGNLSVLPQYERVLYVADLLLGTGHPVLLVGEPGGGKSSLADTLVQPNYLCHRVFITPALSAIHLRQLLQRRTHSGPRDKGLHPPGKPARAAVTKGRSLLLVEDLHLAFIDPACGTSPVTESLRQVLTHQQFYHPETLELQHCPAMGFNCFGTLSVPVTGARPLCPRFGRLFSTVVLPVINKESLLSMHTTPVLSWLEKFPLLTRQNELASTLVRATVDAYEAVRSHFPPSPACSLFHFSLHHIQKVFKGMFLLRPRPGIHLSSPIEELSIKPATSRRSSAPGKVSMGTNYTLVLSIRLIVRLWLHECLRTFCDPLRTETQREACGQLLLDIAMAAFSAKRTVVRVVPSLITPSFQHPCRGRISFNIRSTSRSCLSEPIMGEEETPEEEEVAGLAGQVELGWPISCDVDYPDRPDAWDPVDQAPALALDCPDPDPLEDLLVGELDNEQPEMEHEGLEPGKRQVASFNVMVSDRRRSHEPHTAFHRAAFAAKVKRRPSSKKEISGPLLPFHLLLQPGELPRDIVFSKDLGPDYYSLGVHNPYQEKLWKALENQLVPLLPPFYMLSSEGLKRVVQLCRVLSGPERHAAIVSFSRCTGRRSLVALAAHATGTLLVELPAKADEASTRALLRMVSWQAGVMGRRVLLLVHSGASLLTIHLVLAIMTEGTCPGLYGSEDTVPIIQALLQENQTIKRTMRDDLVLQRFFQFVRSNLHVVLLLGGPGSMSLGLPPLTATALTHLLCSLEIYQPWNFEALLEVASKRLKNHLGYLSSLLSRATSLQTHKTLLHRIARAASLIHCSTAAYASHLAVHLPLVTPWSFLDFLDTFSHHWYSRQEQNSRQVERMKLALHNMGEVSEKQQAHTRDVHFLQEKLTKIKEQVQHCQRQVEREQVVLKQQEKECQLFEARIDALTKERDALEKGKELAMKKMSKDYKAALVGLHVQDIEELRSYRQPPALVVRVTDTLCMLFGKEPGWENAKLLLNQEDFYQELVFYPKDKLSTELFKALGQVVCDDAFSVATIQSASRAAAAIFQWMSAVYWYHWALRDWQPTIVQLQRCDAQINTEKVTLGDRRLHSEYLKDATQARIKELKQTQERQEKLLQQLGQSLMAKEEATTVENSVAEHLTTWTNDVKVLEYHQDTVHGDALLIAAAVTYLGPFPPVRREELLEKWQMLCAGARISLGPDDVSRLLQKELPCPGTASCRSPLLMVQQPFNLVSLLSTAREQRIWDRVHRPKDQESRLAALLLLSNTHARAHRWPLLVDPDRQSLVWLLMASLEEEESQAFVLSDLMPDMVEQGNYDELPEDNLEMLSVTDPDLEQSLLSAVTLGSPVLLTDIEKNVPWCPTLQRLMKKEFFQSEESGTLADGKGELQVPLSFRLYLCTSLPLQALAGELDDTLLKRLNVIDLSLSHLALEDLLLEEVLRSERREILKHRQALQLGVLQLESKLEVTEEELMDLISQPQRSLLEEENFMPIVRLLQTQIQALRATHRHTVSQYQHQAALCDKYRQVARLGVALHLALQQVARLHPFYSFPPDTCISRTRQALLFAKRPDTSKQESLEARLMELSKAVLQHLLTQALHSLREMDRTLYFFLGAMATLQVAGDVSPLEWLAFCRGLHEPAAKVLLQPDTNVLRPSWVSPEAWEECSLLESLPGFQGLLVSLSQQALQWQEYFRVPSTVVGPALCPSHAHLRPFQRGILWRILRPEAMSSVIADLTACLLGWTITEEVAFTNAYGYTRSSKPIIFLMPPVGSPVSYTHPLHWIQQMAVQRGRVGKVVVISFGTSDSAKRVWRILPLCTKKGKWLVLNNCHLVKRWDPDVLMQLDLVLNMTAGAPEGGPLEMHPKFRLWLITTSDAPGSVPGPVQRCAVTLFCEIPLELKSILARTHQMLQGQDANLETEPNLALLVLYSTLLYRQSFAEWTQAETYLWSHGDLCDSFKIQEKLSRLTDNPEEALQEVAGDILYGGYILDSGDAEAVRSLSYQCLAAASYLQPGPGLPSLLATVIGCPSPGLSEDEAAAATQERIELLPSPLEPAWAGLCNGLQQKRLASHSCIILSALQQSQGLWLPQHPPSSQQEALEQLVHQGLQLMQELKGQLERSGWEVGRKGYTSSVQPRPKPRPIQWFLLEEGGSLVAVLQQVGQDLRCIQDRLQGTPCPDPRCATILRDLQQDKLPRHWLPYAPTGPQPPRAWLETLQNRCQLLCEYLGAIGGQPVVQYQLAAFQHPRRLFLALLQEKARYEKQALDCYYLDLQVLPSVLPPAKPPENGLYLTGLELHHALWDSRTCQLQETLSAQPCPLPTVWVQASRQRLSTASLQPTFSCPVYLGAPNIAASLASHQAIAHLPLPCKVPPDLCVQRRVHIISLLK